MTCTCGANLPDEARFCPSCGARQPEETADAVRQYAEALVALGGRTEAWALDELAALRAELHIRAATHDRLLAERAPASQKCPLTLWVDISTLATLRAAEPGVLRLRVVNEGARALRAVVLDGRSDAGALEARCDVLGPGESAVLSARIHPAVAGHHAATLTLTATPLRGEAELYAADVEFRVAGSGALQQSIHIDARNQRVGLFENIGASDRGGLVGGGDWRELPLRAGRAAVAERVLPAVGTRALVTIVAKDPLTAELDGVRGALVEVDPTLLGVLGPGDKLPATVIGHDGRGGLLLSTRDAPKVSAQAVVRVGPGDALADALAAAPAGARVEISGVHRGSFVVDRRLELAGDGVLEGLRAPVLRVTADLVLRGLTVRGVAGPGAYAADAVEVAAGRVVIERCTLSSDGDRNLTPGRALAITGPAEVELRDSVVRRSGVGVAVDVSWSGFATTLAQGATVRVYGTTFEDVGTGFAIAGAGRALHAARNTCVRVDVGARVINGASATFEDNTMPGIEADPGTQVVSRGNRR